MPEKETTLFPDIAKDILQMVKQDQDMRTQAQENDKNWDPLIDQKNTARLKEIINIIGWPSIPKVGAEASGGAWLLAQHADMDLKFQEECLKLMIQLPKEDLNQSNIAYLTDRIQVSRGEEQTFGTQFYRTESGELHPRPIKDAKNLDARRQSVNLEPFEEYSRLIQSFYGKKS